MILTIDGYNLQMQIEVKVNFQQIRQDGKIQSKAISHETSYAQNFLFPNCIKFLFFKNIFPIQVLRKTSTIC